MKKYILIWLITTVLSELAIYFFATAEQGYLRGLLQFIARLLNPYSILYTGHGIYPLSFWGPYFAMHIARIIWLSIAYLFERWSTKYEPAKYVAWVMIFLFFFPLMRFI